MCDGRLCSVGEGRRRFSTGWTHKAKTAYEADVQKYRAAVAAWFDKREDMARKNGDKKAVDQVKSDRLAFEDKGDLPKTAPVVLKSQLASARSALDSAYRIAVREYTKSKRDDEADAVEREWEAFKAEAPRSTKFDLLKDESLSEWLLSPVVAKHWSLSDGVLRFDGGGKDEFNLVTKHEFRNFVCRSSWRIGPAGDSGIFLRGVPQVQIWDHTRGNGARVGSGGLFNNQTQPRNPTQIADKAIGSWNSMIVTMRGRAGHSGVEWPHGDGRSANGELARQSQAAASNGADCVTSLRDAGGVSGLDY